MGLIAAILVMGAWGGHLFYVLSYVDVSLSNPWMYIHLFIQSYLYTGLFITGHDAMHQTVHRSRWINNTIGYTSVFLFAGMSYRKLIKNHWDHHRYPGTKKDPDFYDKSQNFFVWWFMFMVRYTTLWQLLAMAVIFNLLKLKFSSPSLFAFWIIPAFMGTFQLFYFGTFVPHRRPHTKIMGKHKARTLRRNHIWAMVTCYFFGYHFEHHEYPGVPWWKLYRIKNESTTENDN